LGGRSATSGDRAAQTWWSKPFDFRHETARYDDHPLKQPYGLITERWQRSRVTILRIKSFKMIAQAGVGSRPSSYLRGKCGICDAGQGIDE
jgi:hypothetical protein